MRKRILALFVITLAVYAASYSCIQHRRAVQGPWQVTFTSQAGAPVLVVNEPALEIRDVRILFPDESAGTNFDRTMDFSEARPVPFAVPGGQCVFLDLLFLPGTVTFDLFGHEIQLMPRVLTVDRAERPWRSGDSIRLHKSSRLPE